MTRRSTNPRSVTQLFQILHISDLHISSEEKFDRSVVLDPLIEKVKEDRGSGLEPEIVIVSGDIAWAGIRDQYERARVFFDKLLDILELSHDHLFMVPGNHDVNRKRYRPSEIPLYSDMKYLNEELENEEYRADLLKGMEDYFGFVEAYYPHLKSKHGRLVPFVVSYPAKCGKLIGLVGLNSAWMCRRSPDREEIAIGEFQVKRAMETFKESGDHDLIITIFHHPLGWLWPEDKRICKGFLNGVVLLSGHLHDPEAEDVRDLQGRILKFQAGGGYGGSEHPNSFQYITLDWSDNMIKLDYRKFDRCTRKWCLYSEKGNDGRAIFGMPGLNTTIAETLKSMEEDEIFRNYLRAVLNEHRYLATQGFETNLRFPIEIERVYINMHANIHAYEFEFTVKGKNRMLDKIRQEKFTSLDIKEAFKASEKHKIKDMVILGDPGSGKTTLLKYIIIMLAQGKGREKLGLEENPIPFFAPLRRFKNPDDLDFLHFIKESCCLEDHAISNDVLKKTLDKGKGIILLDGLDEVADENTRIKTCQLINRVRKRFPNTRFVVTSRFAGYLGKSRLEGSLMELSVQDFTLDEVKEFLVRWFETVETALHPGGDDYQWRRKGREEALTLVKRISQSGNLMKLAVNPLLLQIIALVHRDRGTLPQRRVELYEECTNVLLEKWDMAKGLDVLLTAREARKILQPLALWLHEVDERKFAPLEDIKKRIEEPLEEIGKSDIDPETLLMNIRDRSGIFMGYSEREFGFTHLSFQEYLAAEQIRNKRDIERLLSTFGNKWWKEVILLCLALDNPSIIEEFVEQLIPTERFSKEIDLVIHAMKDSIGKPARPFIEAIGNRDISPEARYNAVRILKEIGGDKIIRTLKETAGKADRQLAFLAFDALESLGAAEGVTRPLPEEIPETFKNPADNSIMVLVPAGPFLYGSREDDKVAQSNEKPQIVVDLPAFYIDIFPVTNEQYCRFLNMAMPEKDRFDKFINLKGSLLDEKCRIKKNGKRYMVESGYKKHPVIYVSWFGADAYAKWAEKELPDEKEWEKAARGMDGRKYPWGEVFNKNLCNTYESGIRGISEVDRFSGGISPYGCYDLAGNVFEWTNSLYDENPSRKVLRGGSWDDYSINARCAFRYWNNTDFRGYDVGFRCVRTIK